MTDLNEVGDLCVLVEALVVDVEELFGLFDVVCVGRQVHFERHRRRDDAHRVALHHRQGHHDLLIETNTSPNVKDEHTNSIITLIFGMG